MSDSGLIPTAEITRAQHDRRIENLERRAPSLVAGEATAGCCTLMCCDETPFDVLDVGEVGLYCSTDIEVDSGGAVRLLFDGFVTINAGTGQTDWITGVQVNGSLYTPQPRFNHATVAGDLLTLPISATVDAAIADPNCVVYVQNLGTPSLTVLAVHFSIQVFDILDGSVSCGTVAGS